MTSYVLKGQTFEAASKAEIDKLWKNILTVDDTLTSGISRKAEIQSKEKFTNFIEHHCKVHHYMFSVRKCGEPSCVCKPPRLPRDTFDSLSHLPDPVPEGIDFKAVYGVATSEEHRPSLKGLEGKSSGIPFTPTAQFAKNVSIVIQCHECDKWRLIYSKNVLKRLN